MYIISPKPSLVVSIYDHKDRNAKALSQNDTLGDRVEGETCSPSGRYLRYYQLFTQKHTIVSRNDPLNNRWASIILEPKPVKPLLMHSDNFFV